MLYQRSLTQEFPLTFGLGWWAGSGILSRENSSGKGIAVGSLKRVRGTRKPV